MAEFLEPGTYQPITRLFISTNRKGVAILRAPGHGNAGALGMRRRLDVRISNGPGTARIEPSFHVKAGESWWAFEGLQPGSFVVAVDQHGNKQAQLKVERVDDAGSYGPIQRRFSRRGMRIPLDEHIEHVYDASDIIGEGLSFRARSASAFRRALLDTQLFHHDDRADPVGRVAAAATIGEGFREVSTPSLHVAISDRLCSVHIDSYDFLMRGQQGDIVITPDVGQHIFDELLFRMPMPWLRRKGLPYLASVLQALHPVLPNSTNRYTPALGMRLVVGGSGQRDLRKGAPRLMFESTYNFGSDAAHRYKHSASLRLAAGGQAQRSPDWVLSLRGDMTCRDRLCHDRHESVGLYFTAGGN